MNEEAKTAEGVVTADTPETNTNPQPQADVKTFTQDELNRIVSDRLKEDRQKREQAAKPDPLAAREAELAKREFALEARYMLKDKGYDEGLLEVLNAQDKEGLERCLVVIEKIYGDPKAPKPIFTAPCNGIGGKSSDPVRDAMGLSSR